MVDGSKGLHPAHLHMLAKEDLQELYQQYLGKWQCDCCKKNYDATRSNSERFSYHCNLCYYDLCLQCWRGYYHPFHKHRLKPAKTEILYPSTGGSWYCDACERSFHELSGPSCYNCDLCGGVDLCDRCFNGEWTHPLHPARGHHLKPVDPHIQYRGYSSWSCSICEKEKDCLDKGTFNLFHCTHPDCDFDLCWHCFRGDKHYLHQHPLVKVSANWNHEHQQCQNCAGQLSGIGSVYRCYDMSCSYLLCVNCFQQKPQFHPLHTAHPLECDIPLNIFPKTRGSWKCSNCFNSKTETDTLHHCRQCVYSLCHSCYQRQSNNHRHMNALFIQPEGYQQQSNNNRQMNSLFIQPEGYRYSSTLAPTYTSVPVMPTAGYPTIFPPISKSAVPTFYNGSSGLTGKQKPEECIECRYRPAEVTFVHNGMPHRMAICCRECARQVEQRGRWCPLCNQQFERIMDRSS
ncbi:uncharacterized protein [Dysidea avara]|uniref:uncharacterized protein n=1 Tax=Dysidea avara TaxID=196820 RepID=UPI003334000C